MTRREFMTKFGMVTVITICGRTLINWPKGATVEGNNTTEIDTPVWLTTTTNEA